MSQDFKFWKVLALVLLLHSVVIPSSVSIAQQQESHQPVLRARQAVAGLRPLRLGAHRSPTWLIPARNSSSPLIEFSDRNNPIIVAQAAHDAATEALTSLGWQRNAAVTLAGARRVGNLLQNSFRISINGVPVRDAGLSVIIGTINGKLMAVSSTIAAMPTNVAVPAIGAETVSSNLPQYLGDDSNAPVISASKPVSIYVSSPRYRGLRLTYEMTIRQSSPPHEWRVTVDAVTGKLLEKKEMLEFVGGDKPASLISGTLLATVHSGSPFDSLVTVGLPSAWITIDGKSVATDSVGNWTFDNGASGTSSFSTAFAGPHGSVERHDGANDTLRSSLGKTNVLIWNDNNSSAAERDAFYHVAFAREYCQKLDTGLSGLDEPVTINVNLPFSCNAFYDADSNTLNFFRSGSECNNSAEIKDVVFHEFGHCVARARYAKGPNGHLTNTALSEGFADLVSAFIRDDPRIGVGFFQYDSDKVLRTCNNFESFPLGINFDPHVTGEIISGAIWDVRKSIGHDTAEQLFNEMEWLNPDAADIESPSVLEGGLAQTLLDLLLVDDNDNDLSNGTPHSTAILQAFAKHGISLASLIKIASTPPPDQDTAAAGYPVVFSAVYDGPMGEIDTSSIFLLYTSNDGKNYSKVHAQRLNDTTFTAIIPKQPAGSIVSYYLSASLNLDSSGSLFTPSFGSPYTFAVGFRQAYLDDCEADSGWALSLPTDKATRGKWVRGVPNGTYNIVTDAVPVYIQQDTDHTPGGTMCYVTGNLNSPDIEADDVDSGATTLTTNTTDITEATSPLIRYWYYYSNDQGDNSGIPVWQTQISNDDGATWKDIQKTNQSSNGVPLNGPEWSAVLFRVSDYVTPSSQMKLRFIASDYIGAIVEAGIDDIEVLSAPGEASVSQQQVSDPAGFGINSIFPNPATPDAANVTISFSLAESTFATLVVKNVFGDIVTRLLDQRMEAGAYQAGFSPLNLRLASGIYWVELSTPTACSVRKIALP